LFTLVVQTSLQEIIVCYEVSISVVIGMQVIVDVASVCQQY